MIKYKLRCKNCEKSFDSWFSSSKEFEKLKKKKYLNCPFCNSNEILKNLMAPNILGQKQKIENKINAKRNIEIKKKNFRISKFH